MAEESEQVAIRVPRKWLARADALARSLTREGLTVTRTDAFRLAIANGLDVLEKLETKP